MNRNKVCRIVIADSQYLIVEALKSIIGRDDRFAIAGAVSTHSELTALLGTAHCDLLITDITGIDYGTIDDLKDIRLKYPNMACLILSITIGKAEFSGLTRLGIKNIISKWTNEIDFFDAIEASVKGRKFYSDEILEQFLYPADNKQPADESKTLTVSEMEIVKLIAGGLTTKEIAGRRNISYHTVNTHRKNIFRKIEVSNASELIIHAIKSGWIDNIEYYI